MIQQVKSIFFSFKNSNLTIGTETVAIQSIWFYNHLFLSGSILVTNTWQYRVKISENVLFFYDKF